MADRTPNLRVSYEAEQTTPRLPAARRRSQGRLAGALGIHHAGHGHENASASTRRIRREAERSSGMWVKVDPVAGARPCPASNLKR